MDFQYLKHEKAPHPDPVFLVLLPFPEQRRKYVAHLGRLAPDEIREKRCPGSSDGMSDSKTLKNNHMNVELLKEEKETATEKYKEYLQASKTCRDKTYDDLKRVYNHIRKGKSVIDITKAIAAGGVRDNWHPNLAIAQATAQKVSCFYSRNGDVQFRSDNKWRDKKASIEIKSCLKTWKGDPWQLSLEAPVPIIPPRLRPANLTPDYYILWEVDSWTPAPSRDPYLLKRLSPTLFLVCAAWDLTDIEMAVMAGRIKQ